MTSASPAPLILFGAFDRHNFGDLLLAHIAVANLASANLAASGLAPRPVIFAGLAQRDLRPWGGHAVQAIADLAAHWGELPADVHCVGGEVLTCSLYEAAVMLLSPAEAERAIARHHADPARRQDWAREQLGLCQQAAYLVPKALFPHPGRFVYHAAGGVGLPGLAGAMQAEVRARLREADRVSVRDRATQAHLAGWGIRAALVPDPGEQVADLFGARIASHAATGAPAAVRERFPRGYLALQFSADFGDDASLRALAIQLDRLARATGLGLCLFRAGAAPWHDDDGIYRRLMGFLQTGDVQIFTSLHLWDICALLAHARAYCGSSLHGRIVAAAFGVPGINLERQPAGAISKQRAYWETWDGHGASGPAGPEDVHRAVETALAADPGRWQRQAAEQAALARLYNQAQWAMLG